MALALIPLEIVEQVLLILDPLDVAAFSQTCKSFYNLVYHSSDNHLWRALYLAQPLDDPRLSVTPRLYRVPIESIDWKGSLQAIIRTRTVLTDPSKCRPGEREAILRTLIKLLRGAAPAPTFGAHARSANLIWLVSMLRDGVFLNTHGCTAAEKQMRSYLLVHLGLTPHDAANMNKAAALAVVYNMRNYRYDCDFGPFMSDCSGRVNWVHLLAIHRTIAMHLVDLRDDEPFVFPLIPISMPYCQSVIPPGLDLSKERDWAGVEGLWHCTYSFMDHRELLRVNNYDPAHPGVLDASIFRDPLFSETFRVLPVHFRVIGTEPDHGHPGRPRLMFAGEVRDGQTMVGSVEMTPDEHLRWKWVCGETGQALWSCDAVQVGGVRSSFGVLGSWTTIFHAPHDPVGPLWLHKVKSVNP
ncbi:hypothetical protein F5148DRAFT_913787 [Russula earlei]|uniref:Uncharacterized protein n=1 Tax=Russula earlei TaxID=71964 RepID=A0ACC0UBE9_9AGAM|nr:hypothetical protein F5148DRAFT_913787 [Russula earlei]